MIWILFRLAARLVLLVVVLLTVLSRFRVMSAQGRVSIYSHPIGWLIEMDSVTRPQRPWWPVIVHFEPMKKKEFSGWIDARVPRASLRWWGDAKDNGRGTRWMIILHWVLWAPLLALNALLWWHHRRRSERSEQPAHGM
ncbi:MAG: hypothetical protein NXI04_09335 [Planctomycetaceae bacterium]|nr:hypothetical protein [Planctomycetaceae bacterium]